jgi:transcriptional regulator with XRE-family HTH domain
LESPIETIQLTTQPKNLIAARLRDARRNSSPPMTQKELSELLRLNGIRLDRAGIAKIESGKRSVMDYELKGLADSLGISVGWLVGEDDE